MKLSKKALKNININETKKLMIVVLMVFLLGGIGFMSYILLTRQPEEDNSELLALLLGQQQTFNPTIDGTFSSSDGWKYADFKFTEYLITGFDTLDAYNYFYLTLDSEYLYGCADLVSDITNGTDEEWFSVWIDSDNNADWLFNGTDETSWNYSVINNQGEEMFYYNTSSDEFMDYCHDDKNGIDWMATLDVTDVKINFSFQSTPNGKQAHRVYEFRIDKSALEGIGTNYSVAFLGYGTMFTLPYDYYWGAPSYFPSAFYYEEYIDEDTYFHCIENGYDIDTIPN